jgi:hypothetical protein
MAGIARPEAESGGDRRGERYGELASVGSLAISELV